MATANILLVEDDAGIAGVVTAILEDEGYWVIHRLTAAEAVPLLNTMPIDLIISDLAGDPPADFRWIPVQQLRQVTVAIPILVCTADLTAIRESPAARGVVGILPKPFEYSQLIDSVKEILACRTP